MGNRSCCLPCRNGAKQAPSTRVILPNFKFESAPDGEQPNRHFANNYVKTTKYTLLTFLPLNLWEQFHRFANVYFVFIVVLNFMPEVSAFAKELAPIPVVFVLGVTGIKDAFENYRRYRSDKTINHKPCLVYRSAAADFVQEEWQNLWPGDIVRLRSDEVIPADILLLHSSDPAGVCYIETSNIDGETSLKQREVMRGLDLKSSTNWSFNPETFTHTVEVEIPNTEIYRFDGSVRLQSSGEIVAIHKENLLLRGCTMKNTDTVEGMVIYAGRETKAMMNNKGPRFKRSKLERQINKDVIWCVIILLVMCLFGAVGSGVWLSGFVSVQHVPFLSLGNDTSSTPAVQAVFNFWTYIIILQAMIPLSLYVTVEFVKLGQTVYINNDLDLYDEERDLPAECRALNITEDLGQIQYVFSDKTGTLTENKMEFRRCSIHGSDFVHRQLQPVANSRASIDSRKPILENLTPAPDSKEAGGSQTPTTLSRLPLSEVSRRLPELSLLSADSLSHRDWRQLQFLLVMAVCNSVAVSLNKYEARPVARERRRESVAVAVAAAAAAAAAAAGDVSEVDELQQQQRKKKKKKKQKKKKRKRRRHQQEEEEEEQEEEHSADDGMAMSKLPPLPSGAAGVISAAEAEAEVQDCSAEECEYSDASLLSSYIAESPDEAALVRTACELGCKLVQRGSGFCVVWLPSDGHVKLKVLHVLPFDSDRKRMSVIVQHPATGQIQLLVKGADCAVLTRLRPPNCSDPQSDDSQVLVRTKLHLEQYSVQGLRTLCLATRQLGQREYADWLAEYRQAEQSISGREAALSRAMDLIERDLELLGATGIEDRLQDGVPDTIASLRAAGINVWVLTGDKQETAVQIGYSAKLLTERQQLLKLNADSLVECSEKVRQLLEDIDVSYNPAYQIRQRRERPAIRDDLALVLDGATLRHCLDAGLRFDFLLLAEQCASVICCRATPSQKADIVSLVKENLQMQTLAIGDGANDVNMIQTADIGVGLSGQEGMQAVMAADFSLAKFHFLKKLVLVHGHWCYDRLARMSLYLFYKNCMYIMMLFWFQLFNGFSGQVHIGQVYQICFNLTMTALTPLVMGILDRHLRAEVLLANPVLYTDAQNCRSYLPWHFWFNILDGVWQATVVFFVSYLSVADSDCGIWSFGDIVVSAGVLTAIGHNALEIRGWTGIHWFALVGSPLVAWFGFALILNTICTDCLHPDNPYYVIIHGVATSRFWLPQLLAPLLALTPRLCVRAVRNSITPNLTTQAMRLQNSRRHLQDPLLPLRTPPRSFPGPPPTSTGPGRTLSVLLHRSASARSTPSLRRPHRTESESAADLNVRGQGRRWHRRTKSMGPRLRAQLDLRPAASASAAGLRDRHDEEVTKC